VGRRKASRRAMEAFALGRGVAYGLLPRPGSQGTYSLRAAYVVHSASRPRISAPTQADGPSIGSIDGAGRADVATFVSEAGIRHTSGCQSNGRSVVNAGRFAKPHLIGRPRVRQEMVTPLSTGRTWPVTMRDSSLAR
jgi:hypothetical protein